MLSADPLRLVAFDEDDLAVISTHLQDAEVKAENVVFLPFMPKAQLGESFAAVDVFIVSLQRGLAGYIVPSKLYGILASGRPFIAAVEEACEVASIATAHDCGVVVEPGNPQALAGAIRACRADRAGLAQRGANARAISTSFDITE